MLSPTKAHSGKTLTMMDMATTNSLHSKEMLVLTHTEPVSKIDLDALMEMEMGIQTKEMHSLLTKTNGQTPILTEGETITTTTFNNLQSYTLTKEGTHSQ